MLVYIFDRTLDGLLSAVFDAYFRRQQPEMLVGEGDQLPLFSEEVYHVATAEEKAHRVWAGLEKRLKAEALKLIAVSWLSEEQDLPTPLFHYIYKVFQSKGGGGYDFTDADVLHVTNTARRVMHEQLRMKQFVRFQKAKYFITCGELTSQYSSPIVGINELHPERLRPLLISKAQQKRAAAEQQLMLDFGE